MNGSDLKEAREGAQITQQQLARRLHVSQAYISMLERNRRSFPAHLEKKLLSVLEFSPLALPLRGEQYWHMLDDEALAHQLGGLGYSGFGHLRCDPKWNPAELLVAALTRQRMDRRVAEALPWLVMRYANLDWNVVTRWAKLRDIQNRLGFVLTLAREFAEKSSRATTAQTLRKVEEQVRVSRLSRVDTYCNEGMTNREREWLGEHSSVQAQQWNLLSDLSSEQLSHAS